MILPELTILKQNRLIDAPRFNGIVAALAERARGEDHPGILGYRSFSNAATTS